ncbi:hypothetical protein [Enterococcus hirae]|uniref:hypothetical protein n=1 Tax=Enterococcus hirae TaxID=1354 RepID=UPI00137820C4|nr:hypothetical protein [Enterococcus hirae]NBA57067.1 hypothetical protein [Enterococcus hirae]
MNIKNNWLISLFFIPYLLSNIFLFFTILNQDARLTKIVEESSKLITNSNNEFSFFIITIIVIVNLFIFFITFIFLKVVLLILGFKKNYDQDIFLSLLMSASLVNLLIIVTAQMITMNRIVLSISTSIIEVLVFLFLFYINTKDVKATKLLFYGKLLLLLMNIGSLVFFK